MHFFFLVITCVYLWYCFSKYSLIGFIFQTMWLNPTSAHCAIYRLTTIKRTCILVSENWLISYIFRRWFWFTWLSMFLLLHLIPGWDIQVCSQGNKYQALSGKLENPHFFLNSRDIWEVFCIVSVSIEVCVARIQKFKDNKHNELQYSFWNMSAFYLCTSGKSKAFFWSAVLDLGKQ